MHPQASEADVLEMVPPEAEQAELFEMESEATSIRFEASRLKAYEVSQSEGLALRLVAEGRLGFAAVSDVSAKGRLVQNAVESARYGEAVPIRFPSPQPAQAVRVCDERLADLPSARLVEMGRQAVQSLQEAEPEGQVDVHLERRVRRTSVVNSAGTAVVRRSTVLSISVEMQRVRQDDVLMIGDYYSTAMWDEQYPAMLARLAQKVRLARELASLPSGRMPVLFAPAGAVVLLLPLSQGLNGKNVYRGTSPIGNRVGEQLLDAKFTLLDDPTLDGRPGSGAYDDEGVARRRRALIEQGVLKGFIYDLKTAALAGTEPTGNGERSLFAPPAPEFSNLVVAPGEAPLADILAGVDEGLLVEDALGLGQGNAISGAFSHPLSLAFKIEHGEIVGRVKDVSIAGNVYDELKHIAALSREREWVYGGMYLPYVLLPELNVVSKSG